MTDPYIVNTKLGNITVTAETLNALVHEAVRRLKKRVRLDDNNSIEISEVEGRLEVTVDILISFGSSINSVTGELTEFIRKDLHAVTGEDPRRIVLHIVGMISGENIALRDLEVKTEYEA
jgi:uncharacterized alkaline shock family protein YloU